MEKVSIRVCHFAVYFGVHLSYEQLRKGSWLSLSNSMANFIDGGPDVVQMVKEFFFSLSLHDAEYIIIYLFHRTGFVGTDSKASQRIPCINRPLWQR